MNDFWNSFLKEEYEKKPKIFSIEESSSCFLSQNLAIELLTKVFSDCSKNGYDNSLSNRCHINGKTLTGKHPSHLIPHSNENFQEFIHRIKKNDNELKEITFVAHNWHIYSEDSYRLVKNFVAPIINKIGIPGSMFGTDMFAGEYKTTPHGVHRDASGVFIFPVIGHKKILVWPSHFFESQESNSINKEALNINYKDYLDHAISLEGRPGDIIYIPQKWWHIAINDKKEANFTLNISPYANSSIEEHIKPISDHLMKSSNQSIGHIPVVDSQLIQQLDDIVLPQGLSSFVNDLTKNLKLNILKKMSMDCFLKTPKSSIEPSTIHYNSNLTLNKLKKFYVLQDTSSLFLILNGKILKISNNLSLLNLFNGLLQKKKVSIQNYISHKEFEQYQNLLSKLISEKIFYKSKDYEKYNLNSRLQTIQNYLDFKENSSPLESEVFIHPTNIESLDDFPMPIEFENELNKLEKYIMTHTKER